MSDDQIKKHIISFIGKDIAEEVKTLSSDLSKSILRSDSTDALKEFTWDALLDELHRYAPILSALLFKATQTRTPQHNRDAIVGMSACILMKQRNPKMNLVQKMISLVLYAGHSSKEVHVDWCKYSCIYTTLFKYLNFV